MSSVIVAGHFQIQLPKCRAVDEGTKQIVMARTWLMCAGENRIDYTQGAGFTDSLRGQTLAGSNETVESTRQRWKLFIHGKSLSDLCGGDRMPRLLRRRA